MRRPQIGPGPGDARGRVTPGHLILLAATTVGLWFLQQPKGDRAALTCKPVAVLQEWMAVPASPNDDFGRRMNEAFTRLRANCPERIGEPVASLAEQATTSAGQTVKRAADQARMLTNRRIEAVVDGERLKVEALGEARLLGITVPADRRSQAVAYLQDTVLEKRVTVTIDKAKDPQQRPLILVTMPDGSLLNAQMLKHGLAKTWKGNGSWEGWAK